jgi:hypothetical protein
MGKRYIHPQQNTLKEAIREGPEWAYFWASGHFAGDPGDSKPERQAGNEPG